MSEMEVITIDSSDDDEVDPAVKGAVNTLYKSRDVVSQETIDIQSSSDPSDDDSSVSSSDSIWDKRGLTSSSIKSSKERGAAAVSKDICLMSNVEHVSNADDEINTTDDYDNAEVIGNWKVMLLMDHREFGQAKGKIDFLKVVENKINRQFGGIHCEQLYLPAADYLYVARLFSDDDKVIDERVLDLVIERKDVNDLQCCLTIDSKKYKPLSFFEAQMYKLQHCGIAKKLFIMEGDEDNPSHFSMYSANTGIASLMEQEKRLKRVKTVRLQIEKGEFQGVDLLCTKNKQDTIKFLIQQLSRFKESFDTRRPPKMTMHQLKLNINSQMNMPTFQEYLRLRSQPGIGDIKAMKVIMDPTLNWDKHFLSPACTRKKTKATGLEDRPTFWGESKDEANARNTANAKASATRNKVSNGAYAGTVNSDACIFCRKAIDIFSKTETDHVICNRSKCKQLFHRSCLSSQGFDIGKEDGCILCRGLNKFRIAGQKTTSSSSSTAAANSPQNGDTSSSKLTSKKRKSSSAAESPTAKPRTTASTTKRKRPPEEQLYIKRPTDQQSKDPLTTILHRTSFDRNGCLSNPLHMLGSSMAASILLNEDRPLTATTSNSGGVDSGARRKTNAPNICGDAGKKTSGEVVDIGKNDVIVID